MEDFLYEQVAGKLEKLIRKGVLKTGDKLVSVRGLSQEQGISLSTAFKAYSELEQKGLIEARTKSGYYVRFTPRQLPQTPRRPEEVPGGPFGEPGAAAVYGAAGAAGATGAFGTADAAAASNDAILQRVYTDLSDETIIRFAMAAPSIELLPRARLQKTLMETVRHHPDGCMGYASGQGDAVLRRQLALNAFNWGGTLTEEDIVTTHGCMEAVTFALRAVTKPGDTVAVETPTFFGLIRAVQNLGLHILEVPVDPETGVDIEWLARAMERTSVKACLFVTNFSNPLGACMPDERKAQLVDLLARKNVPLIEDDIYGDLYFGESRPRTCFSMDKTGNVLLCSSVSKSLAPGYRVGWCVPGRHLERVLELKRIHSISSTHLTHAAIGQFFAHHRFDLHMRQLRKALHTQSLAYIEAIARYFPPDTKVTQPKGGYVLWVEMNRSVRSLALYQAAIEEKISFSPGQLFSVDQRYSHCMRICFGQPYTPAVDKALKTLGKLVREASA
jgi:DNA-binding transcriptional MocR family regulator